MEVKVQLKLADGSVASSLGHESAVDDAVKAMGLRMYPVHPGTQDSEQGRLFRIPVPDEETGRRAVDGLRGHEGVAGATLS